MSNEHKHEHEERCACHEHGHGHKETCHCHDHAHEHEEHCACRDHKHEHEETCHCHEHKHEHRHEEACHCHDRAHEHHEGACCPHCEAKLHGENRVKWSSIVRIALTGALLALSFFLPLEGITLCCFCLIPYLLIGYDVLWDAAKNIARGKIFDEQFLMTVATLGAFVIAEYHEGVAVMLFYQLGEFFQTLAVGKSRRAIAGLMDIRPDTATVLRGGEELTLTPEEVGAGEVIVIRPGERVPLDGEIVKGTSAVDTAALTGESLPRECGVGDRVISGSVNLNGVLHVLVESAYHDSTVNKILELVEHAAEKKAKIESFITRFSRFYTPFVVFVALMLALIPPLCFGQSFADWVYRALVFLVVSCPCALVISVPLSFFGGIGGASRRGVLIKGASGLEQLSRVKTVAFDKTGTLTRGVFAVCEVSSPILPREKLLALAAATEAHSLHPIAKSIVEAADGELLAAQEIRELAGKGVTAVIDGASYALGNAALMRELAIVLPDAVPRGTVVYAAREGEYLGYIVIRDELKADASKALTLLRKCGVRKTVMLTGDSRENADELARTLSIDAYRAELLPQDKVSEVEALLGEGTLAFVGDGINDAPVLARADVGVAMGGIGSDAAIESADVVLMEDRLTSLAEGITVAKKTMRIVRQNIAFALLAKGVILLLGALGIAGMWMAVFGDVGVMLLAVLNAMRAMHGKKLS